jgi:hypothetical protein
LAELADELADVCCWGWLNIDEANPPDADDERDEGYPPVEDPLIDPFIDPFPDPFIELPDRRSEELDIDKPEPGASSLSALSREVDDPPSGRAA